MRTVQLWREQEFLARLQQNNRSMRVQAEILQENKRDHERGAVRAVRMLSRRLGESTVRAVDGSVFVFGGRGHNGPQMRSVRVAVRRNDQQGQRVSPAEHKRMSQIV